MTLSVYKLREPYVECMMCRIAARDGRKAPAEQSTHFYRVGGAIIYVCRVHRDRAVKAAQITGHIP